LVTEELGAFRQVLFVLGCGMIAILLTQIIMMLIGRSDDKGFEDDDGADAVVKKPAVNNAKGAKAFGLKLLSIKSVVAFVTLGTWVCFMVTEWLPHWWAGILIAIPAGFGASCLMALFMTMLQKQQEKKEESKNETVSDVQDKKNE